MLKLLFKKFSFFQILSFLIIIIIVLSLIISLTIKDPLLRVIDKNPSIKNFLIESGKIIIPIKNNLLLRDLSDKIKLLEETRSCVFCNLSNGDFSNKDLDGIDIRYAILKNSNFTNAKLTNSILRHADFSNSNLINLDLLGSSLIDINLSSTNINGVDLKHRNLTGINFSNVDLNNIDLTGANLKDVILTGVKFKGANLFKTNLAGLNLKNVNFNGANLKYSNLSDTNLDGVSLRGMDLTGVNLSNVDLSNKDLTNTNLSYSILNNTNLFGVDLTNKNLTGVNLSNVDLSNKDLTGTILRNTKNVKININNSTNTNWPAQSLKNYNYEYVTRYDLRNKKAQYFTTQSGLIFEYENKQSKLVLDLKIKSLYPIYLDGGESGLLGIAASNGLVYVSYTTINNDTESLIVDEYSNNFENVRNVIKIDKFFGSHYAGNLMFDNFERLYLSIGDGGEEDQAQDLSNYKGKIIRLDTKGNNHKIIAYGMRNPWGGFIDYKNRMFILQCGAGTVESVYLLNSLDRKDPINLGWPTYEGSLRVKKKQIDLENILKPIFETKIRPGCVTGGVYLNEIDAFLFSDFYGTIRILKERNNGDWYLLHEHKQEKDAVYGLAYDINTKKIYIAPFNFELEVIVDQINK